MNEVITIKQARENATKCPIRNTPTCAGDGTDIECFFCAQSEMSKAKKISIIHDIYIEHQ